MIRFNISFTALAKAFAGDALPSLEECARGEISEMLHDAEATTLGRFLHSFKWHDKDFLAVPDGQGGAKIDTATFEKMEIDFPEGHRFHGKTVMFPQADSED